MIKTSLIDLTSLSPVTGPRLPAVIPDVFSNPAAKDELASSSSSHGAAECGA